MEKRKDQTLSFSEQGSPPNMDSPMSSRQLERRHHDFEQYLHHKVNHGIKHAVVVILQKLDLLFEQRISLVIQKTQ